MSEIPLQIPLRLRYSALIREWRAHTGLSLAGFASQVGLRRQYLWTLEHGASFTLSTLESILGNIRGAAYEPPLVAQVGARLLQARVERGWSQELLSERSGTSIQHLSKIERGIGNSSLDVIDALTTHLGIAGEYAIEGLEGPQLEERLAAVRRSCIAFKIAADSATDSDV